MPSGARTVNSRSRARYRRSRWSEDEIHGGMYRVGSPYSDLTDMVNLSRAQRRCNSYVPIIGSIMTDEEIDTALSRVEVVRRAKQPSIHRMAADLIQMSYM